MSKLDDLAGKLTDTAKNPPRPTQSTIRVRPLRPTMSPLNSRGQRRPVQTPSKQVSERAATKLVTDASREIAQMVRGMLKP